jgi:hypothetical protein
MKLNLNRKTYKRESGCVYSTRWNETNGICQIIHWKLG